MRTFELAEYCLHSISKYPIIESEIRDTWQLALDEIEQESTSEAHECELAVSDIEALIKEL